MRQQTHQINQKKKEPNKENANNHDNIKVTELLFRIVSIEKTIDVLKSELPIVKYVNTKSSNELDNLHQYQRCAYILVDGINLMALREKKNDYQIKERVKNDPTRNLGFNEGEVKNKFDKSHRAG